MSQRKVAVYIDFDKTISPIHGFSVPPLPETVSAIQTLYTKYLIYIYSCRANLAICDQNDYNEMQKYLNNYAIPYDNICRNKPLYAALIDDRSYNPEVTSWEDITTGLMGRIL